MEKKHSIEFCSANLLNGSKKVYDQLKEKEKINLYEFGCLGHCRQCVRTLFAMVDDQYVSAESAEVLYVEIMKRVKDK
ncbi:DUF1450 domain-containing protein [Tepidibacillus infernus]|uniref:DUF1450 domain-containing protein n=1 Tax=Tepidibacillus infernus TaxID=1806172 RepID=UPI003B6D01B7